MRWSLPALVLVALAALAARPMAGGPRPSLPAPVEAAPDVPAHRCDRHVAAPPPPAADATLAGTVRDAAGRPLAGADVLARIRPRWDLRRLERRAVKADASGVFALTVPSDAVVVLEVRAAGMRPIRTCAVASAQSLVLAPGVLVAGTTVPGAVVEACQGDAFEHRAVAGKDGSFALDGLAPGRVRLVVRRDGYAQASLDAEAPSRVDVALTPVGPLRGRVDPAREGLWAVARDGSVSWRVPVAADGSFAFAGVPEGVRLTIEKDGRPVDDVVVRAP